jgi:type IV pilus assembly protein PilQ
VRNLRITGFAFCLLTSCLVLAAYAQDMSAPAVTAPAAADEAQTGAVADLVASQNVTLDFKEADIRNVLKIISMKAGVNIVTTAEVIGNVTIRLVDVPWEQALDAILKTHGFAYDKQGNIIIVAPIDKLTAQKKQEVELAQVQPTATEVFALRYLDAQDAKKAIEPQLSARGKVTILEMTGQAGWEFSGAELGKRKRATDAGRGRSKVLIITDIVPVLDKLRSVIEKIDVKPQQILIEARIMEVSRDRLKDIGFDWGTGALGAETAAIETNPAGKGTAAGLQNLGSLVSPAGLGPLAPISGILPYDTGLAAMFQKLTGTEFQVIIHALEEDAHTNTLSSPTIMALNNQEASILVGTRFPILKEEQTATTGTPLTTITLDYYQDIGIQLNVVPQVGADNHINMVVHPAVTSFSQTLEGRYPIIEMRECETRILMKDGETIVIGGLLKDVKTKSRQGIPYLSKLPLLGVLFSRQTDDTGKLDLLIFITARVVKEGEFSPEQIAKFQERIQSSLAGNAKKKTK